MTVSVDAAPALRVEQIPDLNHISLPERSCASIITVELNFNLNPDTTEKQIRRPIEVIDNSRPADVPGLPIVA